MNKERMNKERKWYRDRAGWEQRYIDNELPWDSGKEDMHLGGVLERYGIEVGKALEIGCGTGTNAIWLAHQGFEVTGQDIAQNAIAKAEAKVAEAGVNCKLFVGDFLVDDVLNTSYQFVYDRGAFHVFDTAEEQSRFASRVAELLALDGVWHSLIGSTDGPLCNEGSPRHSAAEITAVVEPHFEILELSSTTFDREKYSHTRAWILVARRRVAA